MPLVRISLKRGKPAAYRQAIADGVHRAMTETFSVPVDDRFQIINEHDDTTLIYDRQYLNIARSDDQVIVQITCNNTRGLEQKKAFYARMAEILAETPGLRREDLFINLVEVPKENWSFGNGVGQYI
jgi:phenylpyruvate tautomerase PptA (4-oxalocrotonate tautomerase family)